jgi:hypothetical protein
MSDNFQFHKIDLYDEIFSKRESMGNTIARLEVFGIKNITYERLRHEFREYISRGFKLADEEFFTTYFPKIVWVSDPIDGVFKNKTLLEKIENDIGCKCFSNVIEKVDMFFYSEDRPRYYNLEIHCADEEESALFVLHSDQYKVILRQ